MYGIHADDRPNVTKQTYVYFHREDMAQWLERVALTMLLPAVWFRIRLGFPPLNLGTLFRCCVVRQGTSPLNASLDSGENGYQVG